jgi:hypothetical protein
MITKIEILFLCLLIFYLFSRRVCRKTECSGYLSSPNHTLFFKNEVTKNIAHIKNDNCRLSKKIHFEKKCSINNEILSILQKTRIWSVSKNGLKIPSPRDYDNFPLHFSTIVAKLNDTILGFIIVTPWFLSQTPLFVVDHLFVFPKYRNLGIADSLIFEAASPLLKFHGLGIFSTSFLFNHVNEMNKISTLYWYKTKITKNCFSVLKYNFKQIIDANILLKIFLSYSYMANHPLFSHGEHKLTTDYFKYFFSKNGFVFYDEKEKTTLGFYILRDALDNIVVQFGFRWSESEHCCQEIYTEMSYIITTEISEDYECIVLPFFEKVLDKKYIFKYPLILWDIAYVYFYPRITKNVVFNEQHILGWFLPR